MDAEKGQAEIDRLNMLLAERTCELEASRTVKRQSAEEFSKVFVLSPSAMNINDLEDDNRIIECNDAFCHLTGYARGELLGANTTELDLYVDAGSHEKIGNEIVRNGMVKGMEFRYRKKNGEICHGLQSVELMTYRGRRCAVVATEDITWRKRTESELRETRDYLDNLINCANAPVIVWDAGLRITKFNKASEKISGRTEAEVLGSTVDILFPARSRERSLAYLEKAAAGDRWEVVEIEICHVGGVIRTLLWNSAPILSPDGGTIIATIAQGQDITERNRAEAEVRKLNEDLENRVAARTNELEDLYNNSPIGYHSVDENGVLILMNDTELRWLGYRREEVIGRLGFYDLVTETGKAAFSRNFPEFKKRGWIKDVEYDMIRKDGSVMTVLLSATAYKDAAGNFVHSRSSVVDHTDRKKAEVSLLRTHASLSVANRELEAFSYSVSHDLRAPLRAMEGFARILQEEHSSSLDSEGMRLLGVVSDNAKKMDSLIEGILSLFRLGRREMKFTTIDMRSMAQSVFDELAAQAGTRARFILGEMADAYGDASLTRQVWLNIVGNAIKFSSRVSDPVIEVGSGFEDGMNVYHVADNGVGFDMEYANKLFGVFQRLHSPEDFDGTGIGLANVQRIVHRMNGNVWAEGKVGAGATFHFSMLPPPGVWRSGVAP